MENSIVPKEFKFGANIFTVTTVDDIDDTGLGRATECLGDIKISTKFYGKQLPILSIEKTFCHEFLHIIFDTLGEKELGDNERLIDSMSLLLHQFIKENYNLKNGK